MIAVLVKYMNENPKVVWVKNVIDVNHDFKVLEEVKVLMEKNEKQHEKFGRQVGDYVYIHWDFTDGSELSFVEGNATLNGFHTHCLEFFSTNFRPDINVIVVKSNGEYISRNELLQNDGTYTSKQIRHAHNLQKMLIAGSFRWKKK